MMLANASPPNSAPLEANANGASEVDLHHALEIAKQAARAAAEVIHRYYQADVAVHYKSDASPVTLADQEAERAIKAVLKAEFPEHGYFGEETEAERMDAKYLWLIDPIDGTKSFVRNYPIFSTQIALMERRENGEQRLLLGVSSACEFGQVASAIIHQGAECNGKSLQVAQTDQLSKAIVSTGNIKSLANSSGWEVLKQLINRVHRIRGYGDFYHYHLLAQGSIDLIIESDVNILDIAALKVIVEAAGGVMTDLNGRAIDLNTTSILAGSKALHAQALTLFKGCIA